MEDDIRRKVLEAIDQRKMDSFAHVPQTWAVAFSNQYETQEMEGGGEGKDQASMYNKEYEQQGMSMAK